jgi:hypothetical protein
MRFTTAMNVLAQDILESPIEGVHLRGTTLGEQIRVPTTLMVFLRHYACIFCKELVRDIRAAAEADSDYPQVLFFGQGGLEETKAFAEKLWPEMKIVSDPTRHFFTAMGLGKGSVYQMFGPSVWACAIRAGLKGNMQTHISGDIWTMPGVFAVDRNGTILWKHEFEHIAHHPNWKKVPGEIALANNQNEFRPKFATAL